MLVMRTGRRIRFAPKWLQVCTAIVAICGLQIVAVPLIACMHSDNEAMDCPGHAQMHAMHSAHASADRSSGARIQCAAECSIDVMIALNPAPVPQRIQNVVPAGDPVSAPVHENSDPSGSSAPPSVPPPRS